MAMDSLNRMAIFAAVVEAGSMSGAARQMGMSGAAISQHMRRLETDLGLTLLHRTTRKLTLTEAGQVYYEDCSKMLKAALQAELKISELRDKHIGDIRITVPTGVEEEPLDEIIRSLQEEHPDIVVKILVGDNFEDLVERRIDLAIRAGHLKDSSMVAYPLAEWKSILCASPKYLERFGTPTSPQDLAKHRFLFLADHEGPYKVEMRHAELEKKSMLINPAVVSNSQMTLKSFVMGGLGISLQVERHVRKEIDAGLLKPLITDWETKSLPIFALVQNRKMPPKVAILLEAFKRHFSNS